MTNTVAQAVINRDRLVVLTSLAAVVLSETIYMVSMVGQLDEPMNMALTTANHSGMTGTYGFLMLFAMWTVMQVAMMSPTAVPMLLGSSYWVF